MREQDGSGWWVAPEILDQLEAQLDRALQRMPEPLSDRDRAVLTVLFVAERLGLDVKQARGALIRAARSVPSESTISRHRQRLYDVLRRLVPQQRGRGDPVSQLHNAIGIMSYPSFCTHLRRDHGLLLDPTHLQRALNPRHPHPAAPAVMSTVLYHLGLRRRQPRRPAGPALTPSAAVQQLFGRLAYEKNPPMAVEVLAQQLWCITAGQSLEIDRLAERMRVWIRQKVADDPASTAWDATVLFGEAWAEATRARALARLEDHRPPGTTPSWERLSGPQRRTLATLAGLPTRAWTAQQLALIALGSDAADPGLAELVEGQWLAPIPSGAGESMFICPPAPRRFVAAQPQTARLSLEGIVRCWRLLIVPCLQQECMTEPQPYKTMGPAFEDCAGSAVVRDSLDAADATVREYNQHATSDVFANLELAGELVRWMWRAMSDLPVSYTSELRRLGRIADPLLALLVWEQPRIVAEDTDWAGIAAEHALIVAERVFVESEAGEVAQSQRLLSQLVGELPNLQGGLLPDLDAILACVGAERHCWLTAYLSVIQFGILITSLTQDEPGQSHQADRERMRADAQVLAALRRHLMELERREAADEVSKGLRRSDRWNYPSLARWDRGRIPATFRYWSSMALLGEAQATRLYDPTRAQVLFQQARDVAAEATKLYRDDVARTGKWDRVVYALLHQGEVELAAHEPIAGATWMLQAAAEAVRGTLEMKTPHVALACQLSVATALHDVTSSIATLEGAQRQLHVLARQLDDFVQMCRSYPAADMSDWVRHARNAAPAARHRRTRPEHMQSWSRAFMRAVEELALVQDPVTRGHIREALQRLAPDGHL